MNVVSSKNEEHQIHSRSDKKEIMIYNKADEVVKEIFKSLLDRYEI